MKKYIVALLALISIGIFLGFLTVKQNMVLDDDVYLSTTESVRNLKIIDNEIDILLFTIHHENNVDYEQVEQRSVDLSEEFDNLRYDALFEEIEASPSLSDATVEFENELIPKQESIELLIENHIRLVSAKNSFTEASSAGSAIAQLLKSRPLKAGIDDLRINLYRYLENTESSNKSALNDSVANLDDFVAQAGNYSDAEQTTVDDYLETVREIISASEEVDSYFLQALEQATSERLNTLEAAYVDYHNVAIGKSNQLRNALIVYGLLLLILLLVFAYLLRKQYLGLEQEVVDRTEEIQLAYTQLQESQEQLIQSEKMASLGEMVAGVAHEINTPLGYVNSNVNTIQLNLNDINTVLEKVDALYSEAKSSTKDNKKLSSLLSGLLKSYAVIREDGLFEESGQLLNDSLYGIGEISKLVMSLKDFSRLDRQSNDEVDVHDCIENALKIGSNHIKDNSVSVIREFADLPNIVCMPSKLNQLFLNIITNSSQAMKESGGALKITTLFNDENVVIRFADQGVGMDEETVQKVFDPFFTSKPIGEGTGLGMSIAYKIVQAHGGKIQVKSKPNVGTTIAVQLPIEPPASST